MSNDPEVREAIIETINDLPEEMRIIASMAYRLGHEDGWWLNRKNPEVSGGPHSLLTDPFHKGEYRDVEEEKAPEG